MLLKLDINATSRVKKIQSVLHKLIKDMSREDYEEREAPLCQAILQT